MKKGFFLFLSFFLFPFSAYSIIPKKYFFRPDHRIDAYVTGYILEERGKEPFGYVLKQHNQENLSFHFKGKEGDTLAIASAQLSQAISTIQVETKEGVPIGMICHFHSILRPCKYEIYDEQEKIATSVMNFVGSRFSFTSFDNPSKEIATFNRPFFRISAAGDYWYLTTHDADYINPLLLVMIGVFQSELDKKDSPIRS